ncbi:hypothetical protein HPC49_50725, partial [Pyxidicoccus fallax]|nr:hypothetical protein [Pyxidicoccus fallax]
MIERPFPLAHRPRASGSSLELVVSFEHPVPEQDDALAPLTHFQEVAARGGL